MVKCEESVMTWSVPFVMMSSFVIRGKRKTDSSNGGAEFPL